MSDGGELLQAVEEAAEVAGELFRHLPQGVVPVALLLVQARVARVVGRRGGRGRRVVLEDEPVVVAVARGDEGGRGRLADYVPSAGDHC